MERNYFFLVFVWFTNELSKYENLLNKDLSVSSNTIKENVAKEDIDELQRMYNVIKLNNQNVIRYRFNIDYWGSSMPLWSDSYLMEIGGREVVFIPLSWNDIYNNGVDKKGKLIAYYDHKNERRLRVLLVESSNQMEVSSSEGFSGKAFQINEENELETEYYIENGQTVAALVSSSNKYFEYFLSGVNTEEEDSDPDPWWFWWWDKEPDFGWGEEEELGSYQPICNDADCPRGYDKESCAHPRCPCVGVELDCDYDGVPDNGGGSGGNEEGDNGDISPEEYCFLCGDCECDIQGIGDEIIISCDCEGVNIEEEGTTGETNSTIYIFPVNGEDSNEGGSVPSINDVIGEIISGGGGAGGGTAGPPPTDCPELMDEEVANFGLGMLGNISDANNLPASFIFDYYSSQAGSAILAAIQSYSTDISQSSLNVALSNVDIASLSNPNFSSDDPVHSLIQSALYQLVNNINAAAGDCTEIMSMEDFWNMFDGVIEPVDKKRSLIKDLQNALDLSNEVSSQLLIKAEDEQLSVAQQFLDDHPGDSNASGSLKVFLELKAGDNEYKVDRFTELFEILEDDPYALIEDCIEQNPNINISDYEGLFNLQLPENCTDRLDDLGDGFLQQDLDDAHSPSINMDHYSVEITTNPDFDGDGNPDSIEGLFQAVRENFLDLASGSKNGFSSNCTFGGSNDIWWEFEDYPDLNPSSSNQWLSDDPTSTIFFIDAGAQGPIANAVADQGAVIVSDITGCCWVFSTIETPESESQPFSGNRQFGLRTNENGNLEFFTRAVDRAKLPPFMKLLLNDACSYEDYFDIGDATWTNLITEIESFVENNNGSASVYRTDYIRPNYNNIKEQLKSNNPVQIDCN